MNAVWTVIKETYLRQVKSWTFVFLVLSPFIFSGIGIGIGYLQTMASSESKPVALITQVDGVRERLKDEKSVTFDYTDEKEAQKAAKEEDSKIDGYLTVTEENGQIKAVYYSETSMKTTVKTSLSKILSDLQEEQNHTDAALTTQQNQILNRKLDFTEQINQNKENKKLIQTASAAALGFFLYMILITYVSTTAQEVASEKGTKIMEVIFSSIKAQDYFYARMLGIFLVVMTHIGIYAIGGLILILIAMRIPLVAHFLSENPDLAKNLSEAISLNTLCFVALSIYMYVVVAAFLGAIVTRVEDAGKALTPIMMLIMLGFFGVSALGAAGDGIALKIGSYLPFISTFFMPFRAINGYASSVEAWISFILALAFTVGMTYFIGRMYASLILQTDDIGIWKSFKKALSYK